MKKFLIIAGIILLAIAVVFTIAKLAPLWVLLAAGKWIAVIYVTGYFFSVILWRLVTREWRKDVFTLSLWSWLSIPIYMWLTDFKM
ncbi:MAG TPA: hypothetical protein PKK43_04685 [Spirochaetota bacterium]|nr:hypothetical protein [Spirochaetota bacterium]